MIGVMLIQHGDMINKTWILLENCSTNSVKTIGLYWRREEL